MGQIEILKLETEIEKTARILTQILKSIDYWEEKEKKYRNLANTDSKYQEWLDRCEQRLKAHMTDCGNFTNKLANLRNKLGMYKTFK